MLIFDTLLIHTVFVPHEKSIKHFSVTVFIMSVHQYAERSIAVNCDQTFIMMQHQQQNPQSSSANSKSAKMEDGKRIQRVLDELSSKYADKKSGQQQIIMEDKAKQMFIEYANELTASVLEAASMLADHRNSKTIDVEDVNIILSESL